MAKALFQWASDGRLLVGLSVLPEDWISGGGGSGRGRQDPARGQNWGGAPAPAAGRKTVLLSEKRKPPVVGWFVARTGEQKGEDFRIHDRTEHHRLAPDADIIVRDTCVSGKHASLRYKDQSFITDLGFHRRNALIQVTHPGCPRRVEGQRYRTHRRHLKV